MSKALPIQSVLDPHHLADRLATRAVETPAGCWETTYVKDADGYGKVKVRDAATGGKRTTGTHRAAWLAFRGDIPDGLVIDHICRNPPCCNPWHMELVTNSVNALRGDHSGKAGRSGTRPGQPLFACRTHARSDGYLYRTKAGYLTWICRPCRRVRVDRWRAKSTTP